MVQVNNSHFGNRAYVVVEPEYNSDFARSSIGSASICPADWERGDCAPVLTDAQTALGILGDIDSRLHRLVGHLHGISGAVGIITPSNVEFEKKGNIQPRPEWAEQLSAIMRGALSGRASPRYVVYPYSGYDLAAPVAAFRDADVYVLINRHTFLDTRAEPLPVSTVSADLHGYPMGSTMATDVDRTCDRFGGALSPMLGRMRAFFPSFRLRLIQYFVEREVKFRQAPMVHGIVSFDLGEDDKPRTAIYLSKYLGGYEGGEELSDLIRDRLGFIDGFLARGAMGYLFGHPEMRDDIADTVRSNAGVVVEGASQLVGHEMWNMPHDLPRDASVYPVEDFRLSYTDGMRVVMFDGTPYTDLPDRNLVDGLIYAVGNPGWPSRKKPCLGDIVFIGDQAGSDACVKMNRSLAALFRGVHALNA